MEELVEDAVEGVEDESLEDAPTIQIRRVQDDGSVSEASFPRLDGAGAVVVRFDGEGFADILESDWENLKPFAVAQAIYKTGE